LREIVRTSKDDQLALEALWALYVSGGFNETLAVELLEHRNPHIRRWTIRFLGDEGNLTSPLARQFATLAAREPSPIVRSQLACSARRFAASIALPIVRGIVEQDVDTADAHIPLLLWWAVERHTIEAMPEIIAYFSSPAAWRSTLVRSTLQPRLIRRLAAEGTPYSLTACARLLASAPADQRERLLTSLDDGLRERRRDGTIPVALVQRLDALWSDTTTSPSLIRLLMRLGRPAAYRRAQSLAADPRAASTLRVTMLEALGEMGSIEIRDVLFKLVDSGQPTAVQLAAVDALGRFDHAGIGADLVERYPRMTGQLRSRTRGVLLARPSWVGLLLTAIEKKRIDVRDVSPDELQGLARFNDPGLAARIRKLWGRVQPPTAEEKLAEVRRLTNDLRAFSGNATAGKALFTKHCGNCHKLHGEGATIGPDLTSANRKDRQFMLVSIVDPSAVIRKEYLAWTVQTIDGRVRTGMIIEENAGRITLVDAKTEKTTIPRNQIEKIEESTTSLMPDNLLKDLKPQELRDLFAYLELDGKR
jgi:putative heme-binding domain-containing protein